MFGFIKQVTHAVNRHKAVRVILCQDARPYKRTTFYPEYKNDRDRTENDYTRLISSSWSLVDEWAHVMGFPVARMVGYEADDMIAAYVGDVRAKRAVILSGDSDLEQILYENPYAVLDRGSAKPLVTLEDVRAKYPKIFTDYQYILYHSIVGTHNNVKGVRGIGPKTVEKLLDDKEKLQECIDANKELIDRNCRLIQLPFDLLDLPKLNSPEPESDRFYQNWLADYGIDMTLAMKEALQMTRLFRSEHEKKNDGRIARKRPRTSTVRHRLQRPIKKRTIL